MITVERAKEINPELTDIDITNMLGSIDQAGIYAAEYNKWEAHIQEDEDKVSFTLSLDGNIIIAQSITRDGSEDLTINTAQSIAEATIVELATIEANRLTMIQLNTILQG